MSQGLAPSPQSVVPEGDALGAWPGEGTRVRASRELDVALQFLKDMDGDDGDAWAVQGVGGGTGLGDPEDLGSAVSSAGPPRRASSSTHGRSRR